MKYIYILTLCLSLFYLSYTQEDEDFEPDVLPVYHAAYPQVYPVSHFPIFYQPKNIRPKKAKKAIRAKESIKTKYFQDPKGRYYKKQSLTEGPLTQKLNIGDKEFDITFQGGVSEIEQVNPKDVPQQIQYVENKPSQQVQSMGSGLALPYPLHVGGVPFSPLSYPFGVHVASPGFQIPIPSYDGEPEVFDTQRKIYQKKETTPKQEEDFPFTSDYCDPLSGKDKKNCIAMVPCWKRSSCFDCTYDFKCFYCSSTNRCFPSKTFTKDSFTGEHCPASDIYYFQTCRVKSFVLMFALIIVILIILCALVFVGFALIWRRSRRAKIYNIIRNKEDEMNKPNYDEALVD